MNYEEKWNAAMSPEAYRTLITDLFEKGKVTGPNQSESLLGYTKLNLHRMQRLDKTYLPDKECVQAFRSKPGWVALVISEGWCGDASQIVPVFQQVADEAGLEVRYVLRDEHLDLMDLHLTNGGRSIPIILFLDAKTFEVKTTWGPRPAPAQKMMDDHKAAPEPKGPKSEVAKQIQLWYSRDKQAAMHREWMDLFADI